MRIFNSFRKKGEKGFSMIELIVAIAIVGVLVLIAIPIVGGIETTAAKAAVDKRVNQAYTTGTEIVNTGGDIAARMDAANESYNSNERIGTAITYDEANRICAQAWWNGTEEVPTKTKGEGCWVEPEVPTDPVEAPEDEGAGNGGSTGGSTGGASEGRQIVTLSTTQARNVAVVDSAGDQALFASFTGKVSVNHGKLPTKVFAWAAADGYDFEGTYTFTAGTPGSVGANAGSYFPVDPDTGEFTITGLQRLKTDSDRMFMTGRMNVSAEMSSEMLISLQG